jgi:hypothetical protein
MQEETTHQAIRRIQITMDDLDVQIIAKRERIVRNRIDGPLKILIEKEIQELLYERDAVYRNVLQIKNIML